MRFIKRKVKVWTISQGEVELWNGLDMEEVYHAYPKQYEERITFLEEVEKKVKETNELRNQMEVKINPEAIITAAGLTIATWGNEAPQFVNQAQEEIQKLKFEKEYVESRLEWGYKTYKLYPKGLEAILEDFKNLPAEVQKEVEEAKRHSERRPSDFWTAFVLDDRDSGWPVHNYRAERIMKTCMPQYFRVEDVPGFRRRRIVNVTPYSPLLFQLIENIHRIKTIYVKQCLPPLTD